jgi:hypothetical protein
MGGRTRRLRTLDIDMDRRLMEALKTARNLSCQAMAGVDYHSDLFKVLDAMNHAIDEVCVATGRPREHFWVQANSALEPRGRR